jgi:hypothetical protein
MLGIDDVDTFSRPSLHHHPMSQLPMDDCRQADSLQIGAARPVHLAVKRKLAGHSKQTGSADPIPSGRTQAGYIGNGGRSAESAKHHSKTGCAAIGFIRLGDIGNRMPALPAELDYLSKHNHSHLLVVRPA